MKTVALVEDNLDNMLLLRALLQDRYRLQEYQDGPGAAEGLVRDPPDLVLMDIALPGLNGMELLNIIRRNPALEPVPVVALTAHAMTGDRERFLAHGFDCYISKPIVDPKILYDELEQLLG